MSVSGVTAMSVVSLSGAVAPTLKVSSMNDAVQPAAGAVSTQATAYPRWVATVDEALGGSSPDELHRRYVRNAEPFYRG